jgi:hypothetical protein
MKTGFGISKSQSPNSREIPKFKSQTKLIQSRIFFERLKFGVSLALGVWCLELLFSQNAFSQGQLNPPTAPTPTMKSLDQIEARTPISAAPFTISSPGSYYLTQNLSVTTGNAITITANGVTLDLNGFTISSTASPAGGTGVLLSNANSFGNSDITILNGHIKGGITYNAGTYSGTGFANGIYYSGVIPNNVRATGVSVMGCLTYGIRFENGYSSVVELCTVQIVGNIGIQADTVTHSVTYLCGSYGIIANTVADSYGYSTASGGYGISANRAANCLGGGYGTNGNGLNTSLAINCSGQGSGSGTGLGAQTATNCYGTSGSGPGLSATNALNCYGGSTSGIGLNAETAVGCHGGSNSNYGLAAYTANNCRGYSSSNIGVRCVYPGMAIGCVGHSDSYVGVNAYIANCCVGDAPTPISASYVYNMP